MHTSSKKTGKLVSVKSVAYKCIGLKQMAFIAAEGFVMVLVFMVYLVQ